MSWLKIAPLLRPVSAEDVRLRRWPTLLIAAGGVAAAFLVVTTWPPAFEATAWPAWGAYTVLYVVFALFVAVYTLPYDRQASPYNPLPLVALLLFGLVPALAVLLLGAPLAEVLRLLLARYTSGDRGRGRWRRAARKVALDWGTLGPALLAAGALYAILGGRTPLVGLGGADGLPLGMLLAAGYLTFHGARWLLGRAWPLQWRHLGHPYTLRWLALELLVPPPLVVILAATFYVVDGPTYALLVCGTAASILLFYAHNNFRRTLAQRIDELTALNTVGRLAGARLSPGLFEAIYSQVSKVLDAPLFYVALPDDTQRTWTFPLVMVRDEQVRWPPRPFGDGPTERILREGRSLLLEQGGGPVFDTACRAYLGAPMSTGGEVLGVIAVLHPTRAAAYAPADQSLLETIATQAAVVLNNTRLLEQTQRLADELLLINNVSSMANASLDVETIIKTVCQVALELSRAQKAAIFLKVESAPRLRLAYSLNFSQAFADALREFPLAPEHPWGALLLTCQAARVADVEAEAGLEGLRAMAAQEGFRVVAAAPLYCRQDLIGFVTVYHETAHVPDGNTLNLLDILTNQAAVAIDNARLFAETQASVERLGYLAESSRAFTSSLSLETVTATVVKWMMDGLQLDLVTLAMWNRDQDGLVTQATAATARLKEGQPSLDFSGTLEDLPEVDMVLRHGWMRIMDEDEPELSAGLRARLARAGLGTLMLIPLVVSEHAIGLLALGLAEGRAFSTRDVNLAEAIGSQAAAAIQNARLYTLTEDALSERLMELTALEGILRRISASVSLSVIIEEVLRAAAAVTQADVACCALLAQPDTISVLLSGGTAATVREYRYDLSEGVIGRVLRTGRAALIPDTSQDSDYRTFGDLPLFASELCVPILREEEPLGVFNLESRHKDAFTLYHLRFLQHLAGHTAIAVERARLFQARQRQVDILEVLRQLSMRLLEAPRLEAVLEAVGDSAMSLVEAALDVHLYFYDGPTDHLTFAASLWADGRRDVEAATPRPDGTTYRAARSGEAQISHDVQPTPGVTACAIANVPLKEAGRVLGVLNLAVLDPYALDETVLRALELLANQAAVAIKSARLYDEVRLGRDRIQAILNTMRAGLVLVDREGRLQDANPAVERLLDLDARPYLGWRILDVVRHVEAQGRRFPFYSAARVKTTARWLRDHPREGFQRQFEVQVAGQPRYIEEEVAPVLDENGDPIGNLFVLHDITEAKRLEQYRGELTNMIVHDLRSPLTAIIGSLDVIRELQDDPQEAEVADEIMQIAKNTAEGLLNLVESLLDIARLETGELPLNLAVVPLAQPVQEALEALEILAQNMQVAVRARLPEALPPLEIDADKIRRVVINLVDNALRFTPSGGEVTIEAEYLPAAQQVEVRVSDEGPGIAPEVREHIFERFATGLTRTPEGRAYKGLGLGLTFVRLAVEVHGGRVWIEDAPGGGSIFCFVLPVWHGVYTAPSEAQTPSPSPGAGQ